MGGVCERRAPDAPETSKSPAPKAAAATAPQPKKQAVPQARPQLQVSQKPAAQRYKIDYSKWDNLEDSDDEPEEKPSSTKDAKPVAMPAAPTPVNKPQAVIDDEDDDRLTRWKGKGKEVIEELKQLCRKSQAELMSQLQQSDDAPKAEDVTLPPDHMKDVGTIKLAELKKYNATSDRMLVSLYGDVFDVSSRPDLYRDGTNKWKCGNDITWSIITGKQGPSDCNRFYDVFKLDNDKVQRFLQLICQHLAALEDTVGEPVGKLAEYAKDDDLPAAPADELPADCKQQ